MNILSWNIQCGRAVDGEIDIYKSIEQIRSLGSFDVICLQEIARNMEEHCAVEQMDQLDILNSEFSEFTPVWGAGFSWPSLQNDKHHRREFGNLTLIKPVLYDYRVHTLPRPVAYNKRQMQRIAIESVIDSKAGYLSIINVHLAFHDENENRSQIEHLNWLENDRVLRRQFPPEDAAGCYAQNYYPEARVLCGDFNFDVGSSQYQSQIESGWLDAWQQSSGSMSREPTCGIFDHQQWPEGPHCRDFFWLSKELSRISPHVTVDTSCKLSDHQPVVLELGF